MGCLFSSGDSDSTQALLQKADESKGGSGSILREVPSIEEVYTSLSMLGSGAQGEIFLVQDKQGQRFAMKTAPKAGGDIEALMDEARLLSKLKQRKCPAVARLVDALEDSDRVALVMDLLSGKELLQRVQSLGRFSEGMASKLVKRVLIGLEACHSAGIVHLDLKPQNLMFASSAEADTRMTVTFRDDLVLIDFGSAKSVRDDEGVLVTSGTLSYCSPERLQVRKRLMQMKEGAEEESAFHLTGRTLKASDMWSLGVLCYNLLFQQSPFPSGTEAILEGGQFSFPREPEVSDAAKSFVRACLAMKPEDRLTAKQALSHPWIETLVVPDRPFSNLAMHALKLFEHRLNLLKLVGDTLQSLHKQGYLRPEELHVLRSRIEKDYKLSTKEKRDAVLGSASPTAERKNANKAHAQRTLDDSAIAPVLSAKDLASLLSVPIGRAKTELKDSIVSYHQERKTISEGGMHSSLLAQLQALPESPGSIPVPDFYELLHSVLPIRLPRAVRSNLADFSTQAKSSQKAGGAKWKDF